MKTKLIGIQFFVGLSLLLTLRVEAQSSQVPKPIEVINALTVGIQTADGGRCMGMFIAPRVILTAGHCIYKGLPTRLETLNGSLITRSYIEKITPHPEFSGDVIEEGEMHPMDVAYIQLKRDYWENHLDFKQLKFTGLPKKAEKVYAIDHRGFRKYELKNATIQQVPSKDQPNYVTNFVVNAGASGGPLLAIKDGFVYVLAIVRNGAMRFANDGDSLVYQVTNDPTYIDVATSRIFYTDIDVGNGWLMKDLSNNKLLLESGK